MYYKGDDNHEYHFRTSGWPGYTTHQRICEGKNITISTLVRDAVLDRIEDEIDLQLYHDSMAAHRKKSEAISFDDMMKELDLEWQHLR